VSIDNAYPGRKIQMRVGILSYSMLFQRKGGLQVQILETIDALQSLGVEANQVNPNVESLRNFDVIHVFSAINGNHRIVETARSLGRAVVLSPLISSSWTRWTGRRAALLDRTQGRLSGWQVQSSYHQIASALTNADRIVALGETEKNSIEAAFHIRKEKIIVIPNGISKRFFDATPEKFVEQYGIKEGFVLSVAAINNYKNQSAIVQALKDYDCPIILIGECLKEDLDYLTELKTHPNIRYLGSLPHDDPALSAAYAAAGVFVLPSHGEVMPLAVMEALAAGTPVVMTNRHSMRVEGAAKAIRELDPTDIEGIRNSVLDFLKNPPAAATCKTVVEGYSWENVAKSLLETYEHVLRKGEETAKLVSP
jgi:glycosyltransferase involved in cell wall biosynthesis